MFKYIFLLQIKAKTDFTVKYWGFFWTNEALNFANVCKPKPGSINDQQTVVYFLHDSFLFVRSACLPKSNDLQFPFSCEQANYSSHLTASA